MAPLLLHERWFVSGEDYPLQWDAVTDPATLAAIGTAVAFTGVVGFAWRFFGARPVVPGPLALGATRDQLAVVYGWIPLMLAIHTAVPLLVAGVQNQLLVPNLEMGMGAGIGVGLAEVGVALLLFYGVFSRYAALGLAAIWAVGVALFGPVLLLEHVFFLGIAAFFWIAGRGPIAIDRIFGHWAHARERGLSLAVPILRVTVGFSIAWLALSEKLLNLPLALAFVEAFPFVNFLPALGLEVSDAAFLRMAGTVELTAGLLLMVGAFPRVVILLLWLPFNLTLTAFGWQELVGHLPIYAIMALILLWGPGGKEDEAAFHAGLTPVRGKPTERERLEEERGDRLG
ncbi:MAG: DoxX protein [Gemmatimonadota bacterium]|nr:DoxX protein [Gemmatimonadota bacterium]